MERSNTSLVVIGHDNAGKSTTFGHLLYKIGVITKSQKNIAEAQAHQANKRFLKYAWILDVQDEERVTGKSIVTSTQNFSTPTRHWTVAITPGSVEYISKMMISTSQANCAVLFVDSTPGGFGEDQVANVREQAFIANSLHVEHLICCVNKIDATMPKYSRVRFEKLVKEVSSLLRLVGYNTHDIPFVPISGFKGDNLMERSLNLKWYNGPTLSEVLNQVPMPKYSNMPLRLRLRSVFASEPGLLEATGCVETGILKPAAQINFGPHRLRNMVTFIKVDGQTCDEVYPGNEVEFGLLSPLDILLEEGAIGSDSRIDPAKGAIAFFADVVTTVDMIGMIFEGNTLLIDINGYRCEVILLKLLTRRKRKTGEVIDFGLFKSFQNGDAVTVKMKPTKPVVAEAFSDNPRLSRFSVIATSADVETIIALGVITIVEK